VCQDGCIEAIVDDAQTAGKPEAREAVALSRVAVRNTSSCLKRAIGLLERVLVVLVVAENGDSHENSLLGN
jgi:hypothetical protein